MIRELIKQDPNIGKVFIYTEAYVQMSLTVIEQINFIEKATKHTLLAGDPNVIV